MPRTSGTAGGRRPYPGGQFADSEWLADPAKTREAARATRKGPPPGLSGDAPPAAPAKPAKPKLQSVPDPAPSSTPSTGDRWAERAKNATGPITLGGDAAGLILGVFGTVLLLQYLHGGMPQVRRWLAAKFLNRTSGEGLVIASGATNPLDPGGLITPGNAGTRTSTPAAPDPFNGTFLGGGSTYSSGPQYPATTDTTPATPRTGRQ